MYGGGLWIIRFMDMQEFQQGIGDLNSADMVRLYKSVAEYSVSVARQVRTIMKTVLAYAVTEKALGVNVAEMVPLPIFAGTVPYHSRRINADKTLTHEQVLTLIRASKGTKIYLMVMFAVIMGLRCSEILAVKYENIDFAKQKLYIKSQLGMRRIETEENVSLMIKDTYAALPMAIQGVRIFTINISKKMLRDNDLPDVRWHDLRASYTTLLLKNDFSSKAVSKLMGHSEEIITVDVYGDSQELITDCTVELAEFIEDVVPNIEKEDVTDIVVDTSDFLKDIKVS